MERTLPTDASADASGSSPVLLTIPDAARMLSISRSKTYELVAARELDVVHIGRLVRVPIAAVYELVERLRARTEPLPDSWSTR